MNRFRARKPYQTDVSDAAGAFIVPYLTRMRADAPQREYPLREVCNGRRYVVRGGTPWRYMPNDLPPWEIVYQQAQRWIAAGVLAAMGQDLRELLRLAAGRQPAPTAAIIDSRTLPSTPASGHRAG